MTRESDSRDASIQGAKLAAERLQRQLDLRRAESVDGAEVEALPERAAVEPDVIHLLEGPDGDVHWGLRVVPPTSLVDFPADSVELAPRILQGIAAAAPIVDLAIRQRGLFELIGPRAVLDGLRTGALEMVPAKGGGMLGGIRPVGGGQLSHQARFKPVKLASVVGPQLAFAVLTAVVSQEHLAEIRRELAHLRGQVTRVREAQQAERHGIVCAAVEVLAEVGAAGRAAGTMTRGLFQRLCDVEMPLRQVYHALLHLHGRSAHHTANLAGANLATIERMLTDDRPIELHDALLTVLASAALLELDRLLVAHATEHEPETALRRIPGPEERQRRLDEITDALAHLGELHNHVQSALSKEQARRFRVFTKRTGRVSQQLYEDRLAVSDVLTRARHLLGGTEERDRSWVVYVDARGSGLPVVRASSLL